MNDFDEQLYQLFKFFQDELDLEHVNGSCRYLRKNNKQTKTISFPINKRELTENARLEIDLFKESPIFGKTKIGHEAIEITRMNGNKIEILDGIRLISFCSEKGEYANLKLDFPNKNYIEKQEFNESPINGEASETKFENKKFSKSGDIQLQNNKSKSFEELKNEILKQEELKTEVGGWGLKELLEEKEKSEKIISELSTHTYDYELSNDTNLKVMSKIVRLYPQFLYFYVKKIDWENIKESEYAMSILNSLCDPPIPAILSLFLFFKGLNKVKKWALEVLKKSVDENFEELIFYLPQLNKIFIESEYSNEITNHPFYELFKKIWLKDSNAAFNIYWGLSPYKNFKGKNKNIKNLLDDLLKIDKKKEEMIKNSELFFDEFFKILEEKNKKNVLIKKLKEKQFNSIKNGAPFPFDVNYKITEVISDECTVFHSSKKPIKFSFKIQKEKEIIKTSILFKEGDDIRKDIFVLQGISKMNEISGFYGNKDVYTIYKAMVCKLGENNENKGIIQFIDNTKPFNEDEISEQMKPPSKKLDKLKESLAAYSFPCYIFGIEDRNNDNILMIRSFNLMLIFLKLEIKIKITSDENCLTGELAHIDFGIILGERPKKKLKGVPLGIKTISVLEGNDTAEEIKAKIKKYFYHLRHYSNIWFLLIKLLFELVNNKNYISWLEEHLFLYKGDYELSEQIEVIWEENEKRKNSEKINDIIHIMSKNNSIKIKKEIK